MLAEGDTVWIRDEQKVWIPGKVVSSQDSMCSVETEDNELIMVRESDAVEAISTDLEGVDDLLSLGNLHEASILHTLRKRFFDQKQKTGTWIGPILVFVNPYHGEQNDDKELSQLKGNLFAKSLSEAHVFSVAGAVYRDMVENGNDQSIVITGESGSGKTSMARSIVKYISHASSQKRDIAPESVDAFLGEFYEKSDSQTEIGLEEKIVAAGVVLESFGNAQTVRNKNSSRYGKYLQINFSVSGRVQGATIRVYLLEKSRVIHQDIGERNYHIFYQFLAGLTPKEKESHHLLSSDSYSLLTKGESLKIEGVDDKIDFHKVTDAMNSLGFTEQEQYSLYHLLAALISLGNITFSQDEQEKSFINEDGEEDPLVVSEAGDDVPRNKFLIYSSKLLSCQLTMLHNALILRSMKTNAKKSSCYYIPLTRLQAQENRDTLVKTLYQLIFQWIVNRINQEMDSENGNASTFMGILDIFGFEIFKNNRFEQLCINFCNERLQHFFNKNIFEYEQQECQKEGVMLEFVNYSNNEECVNLITGKPDGILAMLDEEGALPGGTDAALLSKLHEKFSKHPHFIKVDPRKKQKEFSINHYAGVVSYEITGFIDRNKSQINPDLMDLMESSKEPFLSDLFIQLRASQMSVSLGEKDKKKDKRKKSNDSKPKPLGEVKRSSFLKSGTAGSVGSHFKEQLNQLIEIISKTTPNYVRCICSNYNQQPLVFESPIVLHQLKCAGILDCVRIRMLGYPIRRTFSGFISRYKCLLPKNLSVSDEKEVVEKQFSQITDPSLQNGYQFGITKVFMKDKVNRYFEDQRTEILSQIVVPIQRAFRAYMDFKQFREIKESVIALQQSIRNKYALQKMNEYKAIALEKQRVAKEREEAARIAREKKEREERLEREAKEEKQRKERAEKEKKEKEEKEKKEKEEKEKKEKKEKEEKVAKEKKESESKKKKDALMKKIIDQMDEHPGHLVKSTSMESVKSIKEKANPVQGEKKKPKNRPKRSFTNQPVSSSSPSGDAKVIFADEINKVKQSRLNSVSRRKSSKKLLPRTVNPLNYSVFDGSIYIDQPFEFYLMEETLGVEMYKSIMQDVGHEEYLGMDSPIGPLSISFSIEKENLVYRLILRTNNFLKIFTGTHPPVKQGFLGKSKLPGLKHILKLCPIQNMILPLSQPNFEELASYVKLSKDPKLPKALLAMDERQLNNDYKFGVLLAKQGQKTEQEFFLNSGVEGPFEKFLNLIGDPIKLQGWKKYRAGLDVVDNIHGTTAYYAEWKNHHIMFHVANLIPFTEGDPQQLERKRHIGNDIVVVVFEEEFGSVESIEIFRSHQNHIIFVVSCAEDDYHVRILMKKEVPQFFPSIPQEGVIVKANEDFRQLFLYFLVTAERAGYQTPVFSSRLVRTRTMLLKDVLQSFPK